MKGGGAHRSRIRPPAPWRHAPIARGRWPSRWSCVSGAIRLPPVKTGEIREEIKRALGVCALEIRDGVQAIDQEPPTPVEFRHHGADTILRPEKGGNGR